MLFNRKEAQKAQIDIDQEISNALESVRSSLHLMTTSTDFRCQAIFFSLAYNNMQTLVSVLEQNKLMKPFDISSQLQLSLSSHSKSKLTYNKVF